MIYHVGALGNIRYVINLVLLINNLVYMVSLTRVALGSDSA